MSTTLPNLNPKHLWANFEKINQIPRGSKKETAITDFLLDFGNKLGLETFRDTALNVLIKKKASLGFENRPALILQSHVDMVHQKNNDTNFNFDTQGIEMYIDGDWIKAKGTTLGADNGIGVAAIMAILQDQNLKHPAIEALFTTDEETGMTGAFMLKPNLLQGKYLLNLDSEDDHELTIGCAGGVDVTGHLPIMNLPNPYLNSFELKISGLQGGHSGIDIHKGYGNAIKILNEIILQILHQIPVAINQFNGGNLRNAIPREAAAIICTNQTALLYTTFNQIRNTLIEKWIATEPLIKIEIQQQTNFKTIINPLDTKYILSTIQNCLSGVYEMDANIPDLVATSNNLAVITTSLSSFTIQCLSRSNNNDLLDDLQQKLKVLFEENQFTISFSGSYPGWQPNTTNALTQTAIQTYQTLFKHLPLVNACHAGLECGIIGQHYPNLEMVSFGPTIRGAHTPQEKVSIQSVKKFWLYLTTLLTSI